MRRAFLSTYRGRGLLPHTMIKFLEKIFSKKDSKDKLARLLKVQPDALRMFDEAYKKRCLEDGMSDNLFEISAQEAASFRVQKDTELDEGIIGRIVNELLSETERWSFDGSVVNIKDPLIPKPSELPVSREEIQALPVPSRPQLTGTLMKTDINGPSYPSLLEMYAIYLRNIGTKHGQTAYNHFRQGLDILDLDSITYQIISTNPNSIGYWLPEVISPMISEGFFKIPKTTIIKVPMPLLQLTRIDYQALTPATIAIVDRFCMEAFGLDVEKDYFVKTGTYSSKFDFRNAHVVGAKEVRELGEYLLYIHFQANCMAHYDILGQGIPSIYGVSTTTEWCVREFIKCTEGCPTIYNGLPLRTEYRAFVDFDTKEVIGIHPYWDPDVMKNRFDHGDDADTPKMKHDSVAFRVAQGDLMEQYEKNKGLVAEHLSAALRGYPFALTGQWSVDIMQNGNDFWLIDMAQADSSTFFKEAVPEKLRKKSPENWIPKQMVLREVG